VTAAGIARRYGAALFDVTRKAGTEERAGTELSTLASLVTGHAELRQVFETPALPPQVKRSVLTALVKQMDPISVELQRLLDLLAERDRLGMILAVAAAFTERLMKARKILPAEIVTAVPLSEANRTAITQALAKAVGSEVTITERVDPAIIGGVVAKVGSVVFDGSVTRQLERLGQRLRTEA
jgi:F-type H+-transporting ATPase subunit delta